MGDEREENCTLPGDLRHRRFFRPDNSTSVLLKQSVMTDPTLKAAKKLLKRDPRFPHRKLSTVCQQKVGVNEKRELLRGVSEITGMIEKLKIEQGILEKEIKADADGIEEYSGARGILERRIVDCEVRLKKNRATIEVYGECIGPLESQYEGLLTDATTRFEDAKKFYDK